MDRFSGELMKDKKMVYVAFAKENLCHRNIIQKHVLESDCVPICGMINFETLFYNDMINRDLIRNANNNYIKRSDETWVYGKISDGVQAEIDLTKTLNKPVRFFDISGAPAEIKEVDESELII